MASDPTPAPNALHVRFESASPNLPVDSLRIARIKGHEAISQLFTFTIDVACVEPDDFHANKVVGVEATLVFEQDDNELRRIHGMIAEVDQLFQSSLDKDYTVYRLVLVPRAYRLALVETQEVFLDTSIPDIAKQKLARVNLLDSEFRLTGGYFGGYAPRAFVVQYLESDLAFVSRLTEDLGISFFFDQSGGTDKMVFTDASGGFRPVAGHETAPFHSRGEEHGVYQLELKTRVIPKKWIIQDYNHNTPHLDLTGMYNTPDGLAGGVVEYGPNVRTLAESKALARVRAEEREAVCHAYSGVSDIITFTAGAQVKLEGHPSLPDQAVVLTEVVHEYSQPSPIEVKSDFERPYRNTFRALDPALTYRPPRITKKPKIHGVQTGRIEPQPTGYVTNTPANDANGNYTVRFHFDTSPLGKKHRHSLPIRMIQTLSGGDYGVHFPLRVGIEVLVIFIDGDPDRPLISGAVPNPLTLSPLKSVASSLSSRMQTNSGLLVHFKDGPGNGSSGG